MKTVFKSSFGQHFKDTISVEKTTKKEKVFVAPPKYINEDGSPYVAPYNPVPPFHSRYMSPAQPQYGGIGGHHGGYGAQRGGYGGHGGGDRGVYSESRKPKKEADDDNEDEKPDDFAKDIMGNL